MLRKIFILLMSLTLCWTTVACGSKTQTEAQQNFKNTASTQTTGLSSGKYPVQQATYNDIDGEYSLMLLNTPPGTSPVFRTTDLQMARLTDEEIAAEKDTYLEVNGDRAVMHLSEDFRIEYVHNVTETQTNPQTGEPETVIVRRESNFWTPFAGALAGQAVGSLLFRPQYYVPPVYQPGVMTGFGGYGNTYTQAVDRYQSRYQAPPPAVRNRQTLRTTGRIRNTSSRPTTTSRPLNNRDRSTGSGYGSSKLRSSGKSPTIKRPRSSFGSGIKSRPRSGMRRRR